LDRLPNRFEDPPGTLQSLRAGLHIEYLGLRSLVFGQDGELELEGFVRDQVADQMAVEQQLIGLIDGLHL